MGKTIRHDIGGKKVRDGKISSPACRFIRTDGVRMLPEVWDTDDPQSFNPKHKREVKRIAHKKVRQVAKSIKED